MNIFLHMINSIRLNYSTLEKIRLHRPSKSTTIPHRYNDSSIQGQNPKEINIISPFYDKNKCNVKGPCLCPFHRKKREKFVRRINDKTIKISYNNLKKVKKTIKVNTEPNQKKNVILSSLTKQSLQQTLKNLFYPQKQYYSNILHKVECRNSQFQQFLKKNELYILTGKFSNPNNKMKQDYTTDQNYLENFSKFFQTDPNFSDNGYKRYKDRNKSYGNLNFRDPNRKQTIFGTRHNLQKSSEGNLFNKIKGIIECLINRTKKFNLRKMKKIRQLYFRLLEQHRQINGEDAQYIKNKQFLQKFDKFIKQYDQKSQREDCKNRKNKNKQNLNSLSLYNTNSKTGFPNQDKSKKNKRKILTQNHQMQVNQSSLNCLDKQNAINTQFCENINVMSNENRNVSTNQFENESSLNYNQEQFRKAQMRRNSTSLYSGFLKRNISKYAKKNNFSMLNQLNAKNPCEQKKTKQQQKFDKQHEFSHPNYNQDLFYHNGYQNHKNLKQAKLQQIFNNMKDDQKLDKNYLKMKKYIEKNKKFIKKMEMKLLHLQLGMFVIQPTDSLITRKKKIRCMKEMLDNRKQGPEGNKGFYDEIMKYLDIYTQHCNMLMKKDVRKNRNDEVDIQFAYENLPIKMQSKDFNNSLKFISLNQNEECEKQKRLEGWISIPQYITKDHTRIKQSQKFQQSVKYIEGILKTQKIEESSSQSEDSLIQTNLQNTCAVKRYTSYCLGQKQNEQLQKQRKDMKANNKIYGKLQVLKKRLLKNN